MMPHRSSLTLSVALGALLVAMAAHADIPPPPNSPNAHCTPAEQCPTGSVSCPYTFRPGQPPPTPAVGEDCRAEAAKKGLERRCRHGGNYSGDELFCPPGATGSWKPDPVAGDGTSGATKESTASSVSSTTGTAPGTDASVAPASNTNAGGGGCSKSCALAPGAGELGWGGALACLGALGFVRRRATQRGPHGAGVRLAR